MAPYFRRGQISLYKFILSSLAGFCIGTYIISHSDQSTIKPLQKIMCLTSPYPLARVPNPEISKTTGKRNHSRKGMLYIGVMSMNSNLNSRVAALLSTWGRHPGVKLEIFAKNNHTSSNGRRNLSIQNGARIISLPGVADISYPPQKKSFSMLKFIHDNHLNNFDWFMRTDDDAYVKIEELMQFLSQVDASKPLLIGQPGYGKHAEDNLFGGHYCMGGTGVLLSRELLRQIGPELSACLKSMYTEHEDIELGRCIRRVTGVSCITAWEASTIFYQNYGKKHENIEIISEKKRDDALTFHSNKDPKGQCKFRLTILRDRIKHSQHKIARMEAEVKKMERLLQATLFNNKGSNMNGGYVLDAEAVERMFSEKETLSRTPATVVEGISEIVLYGVSSDLRLRNGISNSQIRDIVFKTGSYLITPLASEDLIANVEVQMTSKYEKDYRKHVRLRRTFLNNFVYLEESQTVKFTGVSATNHVGTARTELDYSKRVHFIVGVNNTHQALKRFLKIFDDSFLATGQNVSLTVVNIISSEGTSKTRGNVEVDQMQKNNNYIHTASENDLTMTFQSLSLKYPYLSAKIFTLDRKAPIFIAFESHMLSKGIDEDEILFFCNVNMIFSPQLLHRVRRSTIAGQQAYNPIAFTQYDSETIHFFRNDFQYNPIYNFDIGFGFWRTLGCEALAIYKSDFVKTAWYVPSVWNWWRQPENLCEAASENQALQIFKAKEPGLAYVYYDGECPEHLPLEQQKSCRSMKAQYFQDQTFLYHIRGANGTRRS